VQFCGYCCYVCDNVTTGINSDVLVGAMGVAVGVSVCGKARDRRAEAKRSAERWCSWESSVEGDRNAGQSDELLIAM